MNIEGDHATLVFERRLAHSPEEVWRAITDPDQLSEWYMARARIDGRTGGSVDFSRPQGRVTGNILVWDPPRVLEHEWNVDRPGFRGPQGIVRWELRREGNNTLLTLTHRSLPQQIAPYSATGIHAILDRLEAHLDRTPLPDWLERQEEVRASYIRKSS